MLEKPHDGWSRLHLFDADIVISCVFDGDNPFGWLKACQFGLENHLPATLLFDSEDSGETIVIADDSHTTIFIDNAYDGMSMHIYEDYNIMNLTEDIFLDISRDFDSWIEEWIDRFDHPNYFSHEDIEFKNKMMMQGQYFRVTEKIEMRLKVSLREAESAYLRRKWKERK